MQNLENIYLPGISINTWATLNSKANKFVWLIHKGGFSVLPLRLGADPFCIEHYTKDPLASVFLIDWPSFSAIEISPRKAIEFSHLPPHLNNESTADAIFDRVWEVLEEGCECELWGYPPIRNPLAYTYSEWHQYFLEIDNIPMSKFMSNALKLLQKNKTAA